MIADLTPELTRLRAEVASLTQQEQRTREYAERMDAQVETRAATIGRLQQQIETLRREAGRIASGFRSEAMNGVICTPPMDDNGFPKWDAPPSRTWCPECRQRWSELFGLAAHLTEGDTK